MSTDDNYDTLAISLRLIPACLHSLLADHQTDVSNHQLLHSFPCLRYSTKVKLEPAQSRLTAKHFTTMCSRKKHAQTTNSYLVFHRFLPQTIMLTAVITKHPFISLCNVTEKYSQLTISSRLAFFHC